MTFLYRFLRYCCSIFLRIKYKIEFRYDDKELFDDNKGLIICANHHSNCDPILLAWGCPKQIFYMSKEELFQKSKIFAWALRGVGAFPVSRGKGDMTAIKASVDIIRGGRYLGIFPEGTRSKTGELQRAKSGAALIASKTKADILPVGITYEDKDKFRSRVIIHFGSLIKNSELFSSEEISPRELKSASHLLMDRIASLRHTQICVKKLDDAPKSIAKED